MPAAVIRGKSLVPLEGVANAPKRVPSLVVAGGGRKGIEVSTWLSGARSKSLGELSGDGDDCIACTCKAWIAWSFSCSRTSSSSGRAVEQDVAVRTAAHARILLSIFSYTFREMELPDSESKTGTVASQSWVSRGVLHWQHRARARTFIVRALGVLWKNSPLDSVGDGVGVRAKAG